MEQLYVNCFLLFTGEERSAFNERERQPLGSPKASARRQKCLTGCSWDVGLKCSQFVMYRELGKRFMRFDVACLEKFQAKHVFKQNPVCRRRFRTHSFREVVGFVVLAWRNVDTCGDEADRRSPTSSCCPQGVCQGRSQRLPLLPPAYPAQPAVQETGARVRPRGC